MGRHPSRLCSLVPTATRFRQVPVAEGKAICALHNSKLHTRSSTGATLVTSSEARYELAPHSEAEALARVGTGTGYPRPCNTGVKCQKVQVVDLVSAGPDWFTLTAISSAGVRQLYELYGDTAGELLLTGDLTKEARQLGYHGYVVGRHLFYGERGDGEAMLRASSHVAVDVLSRIRQLDELRFRATRVDLQITVSVDPACVDRAFFRELADMSNNAASVFKKDRGTPWHTQLRDTYGRGDTVEIGSRASEAYGRIYDKHKESIAMGELYTPGSIRFETEHKRSQAEQIMRRLAGAERPEQYVVGYLDGWYETHGIKLPVRVEQVEKLCSAPRRTDLQTQLRWLREQVAPTVQRLVAAGYCDEALQALGLYGQEHSHM